MKNINATFFKLSYQFSSRPKLCWYKCMCLESSYSPPALANCSSVEQLIVSVDAVALDDSPLGPAAVSSAFLLPFARRGSRTAKKNFKNHFNGSKRKRYKIC